MLLPLLDFIKPSSLPAPLESFRRVHRPLSVTEKAIWLPSATRRGSRRYWAQKSISTHAPCKVYQRDVRSDRKRISASHATRFSSGESRRANIGCRQADGSEFCAAAIKPGELRLPGCRLGRLALHSLKQRISYALRAQLICPTTEIFFAGHS